MVEKDLRHPAKWWHSHSTSQYQGSETNYEHTEVEEAELGLVTNSPISYYGLVTRDPDKKTRKPSS